MVSNQTELFMFQNRRSTDFPHLLPTRKGRDSITQKNKQTKKTRICLLFAYILNKIWIKINTHWKNNQRSTYFFVRKKDLGALTILIWKTVDTASSVGWWVAKMLSTRDYWGAKCSSQQVLWAIIHKKKIKFSCENTWLTEQDQKTDVIISQLLQNKRGSPCNF